MKKNEALKNLLAVNPRICKYLHKISNFDWQNEFFAEEFKGKFTYNSLIKSIESMTKDAETQPDEFFRLRSWNVYLFYLPNISYYGWNNKTHIAKIADLCIKCKQDELKDKRGYTSFYNYGLNVPVMKSDFEKIRKSPDTRYWLVIQAKALEKSRPREYEATERYEITNYNTFTNNGIEYIHDYNIKPIYKNYPNISISPNSYGRVIYTNVKATHKNALVDKSGYRLDEQRRAYKARVSELKAQRSAAAAAAYDNTEKYTEIETRIRKINDGIAEFMKAEVYNIPYKKIENCCNELRWINDEITDLHNNKFSSMEKLNRTIEIIEHHIRKAEAILNKE